MAFWKVCFLMGQLIGLGLAQTDGPVVPVELREFEEIRQEKVACPDKSYTVLNQFCYKVFPDRKTWIDAEDLCTKEETAIGQGHLVSILNQQENEDVFKLWQATNPPKTGCYSTAWIGLSDTNDNDNIDFIWSDGKSFNYTNWKPNANLKNLKKSCVSLWKGFWETTSCERKMAYICKVPL
ncbi:snaclec rhodocetin subunit alpha-like [Asterias amurensis]|uniref:snaclec rhodocetin subunit alpha-like n=1 Tax=Asterias amurensis TaxID=7602 RepID=UPI003AB3CF69